GPPCVTLSPYTTLFRSHGARFAFALREMRLRPDPVVTPEDVERGKEALVRDAAWATLAGSLYGGVILVGFAVALGASPMVIGLLDRKSTRLNSSHVKIS